MYGRGACIFKERRLTPLKRNRYEIDMCSGSLMPKLISFALPLIFSGILQLLFNAVDLVVVGRFSGSNALAAVGASTFIIHIFVNFFIGISLGVNVTVARYYGAEDEKRTERAVHTAILTAIISGVLSMALGIALAQPALRLLGTPDSIIGLSKLYIRIYFLGTPFFMLYNFGAAVLRAVGDTKRPMIYLIISGMVNAILNVIFVTVFKMSVAGVAIATAISQLLSCIMILVTLIKSDTCYKLDIRKICIDKSILKQILRIGVPAGLQTTVITASNALLQSSVNSFGENAVAGYAASNNIFGFMFVTVNSITQGCMSFVSQNLGAGKLKRMKKSFYYSLILELTIGFAAGAFVYILRPQLIGLYSDNPEVITYGVEIFALSTLTYFMCGFMDCTAGAMRGMGYSAVPMVLSLIGTVAIRVIWIYYFFPANRNVRYLFISYPLSWVCTFIMQMICYMFVIHIVNKKFKQQAKD